MLETLTRFVLLCLISAIILFLVYAFGHDQGSRSVQARWDEERYEARMAQDLLKKRLSEQESAYNRKQEQVADELARIRKTHAGSLARQRSDYEQRLLQSARRGEVYRDQAEASASACRDLASHAARLDRALEEGRGLVNELGTTLGLRDRQLKLLGDQISNDRRWFEGEAGGTP